MSEVPLSNGDTATVFHTLYSTAIVCSQQPARFLAKIYRYSSVDKAPLPENTTVFVVAKAYIPPEGVAGIGNSMHCIFVPCQAILLTRTTALIILTS